MHWLHWKWNTADPRIPKQTWKSQEIFSQRVLCIKMSIRSTDLGFALALENKLLTSFDTDTLQWEEPSRIWGSGARSSHPGMDSVVVGQCMLPCLWHGDRHTASSFVFLSPPIPNPKPFPLLDFRTLTSLLETLTFLLDSKLGWSGASSPISSDFKYLSTRDLSLWNAIKAS